MTDTDTNTDTNTVVGSFDALSPVQQRTLEALRRRGDPLVFDADFITSLRSEIADALDFFAGCLDDGVEVWVSKHKLAAILDCEEQYLIRDEFEWNAATAQGSVVHKAIELFLSWPPSPAKQPTAAELVDTAIGHLAAERRGVGEWIAVADTDVIASVVGRANEWVVRFIEDFPPLSARSMPITEASLRWPKKGPIVLAGKVDVMFGSRPAPGADIRESRKVIVDFKTGRPHPRHRQDLAFYALLETLIREVPPRKVATFYIDAAAAETEDVSERLLLSAMRRTLDGIAAIVDVEHGSRPPIRRAGSVCRWCAKNTTCDDGVAYLAGINVVS